MMVTPVKIAREAGQETSGTAVFARRGGRYGTSTVVRSHLGAARPARSAQLGSTIEQPRWHLRPAQLHDAANAQTG
jgi:hypothetical protein